MTETHNLSDAQLLSLVGEVLNLSDPVPDTVIEGAMSAFWWPRIHADLAELTFDSIEFAPAAARAVGPNRMLTFQSTGYVVELEFSRDDALLLGLIQPAAEFAVEVIGKGGTTSTSSDSQGRFEVQPTASGPMGLIINRGAQPVLQTEAVLL